MNILGMGKYLPTCAVSSESIDAQYDLPCGTIASMSGVDIRHYAQGESVVDMAVSAVQQALYAADLRFSDLDAMISTGATFYQPIPCTASFIQKKMGQGRSGVACFDINATCLGFLVGFDVAVHLLKSRRFKKILLISSEIASTHLNPAHIKSMSLFGDGAVAMVLSASSMGEETNSIFNSRLESYSEYSEYCRLEGGGSKLPAYEYNQTEKEKYWFHMDGAKIFKITYQLFPGFLQRFFTDSGYNLNEVDFVIPHQASASAMSLLRKKLGIAEAKWMSIIHNHGNMISASIPATLYEAIAQKRIKKGDLILLIGTGAGLSMGALLFRY